MASIVFFYTAMTLIIPEIYLASNIVNSIECDRIPCSSPTDCPTWHYCDPHQRFCQPCTQCIDGADAERARVAAHRNCQDPMSCIASLYDTQDYACPKLLIVEGNHCWGRCKPCGGSFGSYLGTTCRVDCSDGDWDIFSCIYINEVAQWNFTRKPYWINCETFSPPSQPTTTPPTSLPAPTATTSTVYHLEALAGIVAGTVLGVCMIVVFAIMLIVWVHRRKEPTEKMLEVIEQEEEEAAEVAEERAEDEERPILRTPVLDIPEKSRSNGPVETEDPLTGSSGILCSRYCRRESPQAVEMSDHGFDCSGDQPPLPTITSLLKPCRQTRDQPSSSPSLVSLHSDHSGVRFGGQPQERSAPLVDFPPGGGSSDSGHPLYGYSSSNSLRNQTVCKSVTDIENEFPREPVELSHYDTSSSDYYPRDSVPDCRV